MRLQSSLWLTLVAVSLTAACSSSLAQKNSTPTAMPVRPTAAQPVQATPIPKLQLGRLAFVKGGDIWVKDLPDGQAHQLTHDGRNGEPRWSPSGEWLTFVKDAGIDGSQLWVIRLSGGEPRLVGSAPRARAFWSPVADRFACVTQNGLAMEDADGSNRRGVSARVQGDPVWSPDGLWLSFGRIDTLTPTEGMKGPALRGSIWRVRADGSDAREILDGGSPSLAGFLVACWTPDGSNLLYWTNPYFSGSFAADGGALMSVPVDGGQPRELVKGMLLHRDFLSWSPSGRELVLVDGSYRSSWYRKQIAVSDLLGQVRPLSEPSNSDLFPSWSPDGRSITYTSAPAVQTDGGNDAKQASWERRIWVMAPDGSGKRQLTSDPTYRDERPVWSRDGAFILFGRMLDDQMQLWLIRPDGLDLKQVVEEVSPLPDPVARWFGYYGYLDWGQMYDWWLGPPSRRTAG